MTTWAATNKRLLQPLNLEFMRFLNDLFDILQKLRYNSCDYYRPG